ncbi:hypothetical protein NO976_03593 [Planktothrix agardhii]|jgi:hypothetical protein|nr:hypothetical protein PCC7805_00018 [Planktothrix agardhii]BBD53246.1 hypothetical protein NIES204_05090 [Planktothrix agardhii NIES-204]CAD5914422.1 hypothetical protein NO2A_00684 [Planktothrix agardhii]CAD5917171.1 hypothetical protein PCC7811_00419 [Planktothrix agardhii]CAD5917317.1 hypothetical protein NO365_00425 [Planktothrix agardhii]
MIVSETSRSQDLRKFGDVTLYVVGVIHELPLQSGLNLKKYDNSNRTAIDRFVLRIKFYSETVPIIYCCV